MQREENKEKLVVLGSIENIIYRNTDNDYSIFLLFDQKTRQIYKIGGVIHNCTIGLVLECEIDQPQKNPKYPDMPLYKLVSYELPPIKDERGIKKYLIGLEIPGVGEKTINNIFNKFGEDTIEIIETNPIILTEIKGISKDKARLINEKSKARSEARDVIITLLGYGIGKSLVNTIVNYYGASLVLSVIKENPYVLMQDIKKVGFKTADEIAKNVGIKWDSIVRMKAIIEYLLNQHCKNFGHTYIMYNSLEKKFYDFFREGTEHYDSEHLKEKMEYTLDNLRSESQIDIIEDDYCKKVALIKYLYCEKKIASELKRIDSNDTKFDYNISFSIENFEKNNQLTLHESQVNAIKKSLTSNVSIITGGPGTGKTTIVKAMIYIIEQKGRIVKLAAPTGRASKRMSEATGREAFTIHRLLEYSIDAQGKAVFKRNQNSPLDADVIILDEASMCDIFLFSSLCKAIATNTQFIIIGDSDQLPSVGPGNVLADIIDSNVLPVSKLEFVYRQGENSLIIQNAKRINNRQMPIISSDPDANEDFEMIYVDDTNAKTEILKYYCDIAPTKFNIPLNKLQMLCSNKTGETGTIAMNKEIQKKANPNYGSDKFMRNDDFEFYVGDRVMHTENNYQLQWEKKNKQLSLDDIFDDMMNEVPEEITIGQGVFNGEIGDITSIKDGVVTVQYDREVKYKKQDLSNLDLAYAITIHKSQGSEFPVVVMLINGKASMILNKKALYTRVTRAKKQLSLFAIKNALKDVIEKTYPTIRYTMLKDLLIEEFPWA